MNFMGDQEPSKRDLLEIDNEGKTTAQNKKDRRQKQQQDYEQMQQGGGRFGRLNPRNRFGRNKGMGRGGYGGRSEGTWLNVLLAIAIVSFLIWLVWASMNGGLSGGLRSFNSSSTANRTALENAFYDLEHKNKNVGKEVEELNDVREENRIHKADMIISMPYPEYIVYVFTGDDMLDSPFNQYVRTMEEVKDFIPIYRLDIEDVPQDHYIRTVGIGDKPAFVFFRGTNGEYSAYDSVLYEVEYFDEIPEYVEGLKAEYDEAQRDRIGTYGQSKGFQDLTQ